MMKTTTTYICVAFLCIAISPGLARRQLLQTPAPAPAPGSCLTVADVAQDAGLSLLLEAATEAGLAATLSDSSLRYTVFAPTDDAFAAAANGLNVTAEQLLSSSNLGNILRNHLLAYPLHAYELAQYRTVKTEYNSSLLSINADSFGNETLTTVSTEVITANVILADQQACQSIVHIIDEVLVPEITSTSSA